MVYSLVGDTFVNKWVSLVIMASGLEVPPDLVGYEGRVENEGMGEHGVESLLRRKCWSFGLLSPFFHSVPSSYDTLPSFLHPANLCSKL